MDTIPDVLYQSIFSYLLGDQFDHIFFADYRRVLLVNKVFQKCAQHYVKTTPFKLNFCVEHRDDNMEALDVIRNVNKYDITIYGIELRLHHFMLNGLKLSSSLRRLRVTNQSPSGFSLPLGSFFDWRIFKNCTKLTSISIDSDLGAGKHRVKDLLLSNKNTLEDLTLFIQDIDSNHFLRTDMSWPNLKTLSFNYYNDVMAPNPPIININCPKLQRLVIKINEEDLVDADLDLDFLADADLDLLDKKDRDNHGYDYDYYGNTYKFKTCSISDLEHIGMVVDVSKDCNIILKVRLFPRF
jgi:hypothetical protein